MCVWFYDGVSTPPHHNTRTIHTLSLMDMVIGMPKPHYVMHRNYSNIIMLLIHKPIKVLNVATYVMWYDSALQKPYTFIHVEWRLHNLNGIKISII